MKITFEPIKNWFGFTRMERRSSFILLLIIILLIVLRSGFPENSIALEDITDSISALSVSSEYAGGDLQTEAEQFTFDPNTASFDTLIKLGLVSKEANTLIRYRSKGGKFRYPSDIKKVYGIDEAKAQRLIPLVVVITDTPEKAKVAFYQQETVLLDLNNCDSASLVRLQGIGPVLSARIIKYRHLLGGYARIDQLKEVYGLPQETFDIIRRRVYVDSLAVIKININSAGYKELSRLPYFEKYEVTAILKYRELMGRINSVIELSDNKLISKEKAAKAGPYLKFE